MYNDEKVDFNGDYKGVWHVWLLLCRGERGKDLCASGVFLCSPSVQRVDMQDCVCRMELDMFDGKEMSAQSSV